MLRYKNLRKVMSMKRLMMFGLVAGVILLAASGAAGDLLDGPLSGLEATVGASVYQELTRRERVSVIVMLRATPDGAAGLDRLTRDVAAAQASVLGALSPGELELTWRYRTIPALAGKITAEGVAKLAGVEEVRRVDLDQEGKVQLAQAVPLTNSDDMHGMGFTGEGVTVAIIDTGLDTDHPDLADDLVDEACFCSGGGGCCPNNETTQFGPGAGEDTHGHGTGVAGIVTSAGIVAPVGVAPDAGILMVKVSSTGSMSVSDVIAALDWIRTDCPDVRVINMSFSIGTAVGGECDALNANTQAMAAAIDGLRSNGVMTFSGTGNNASTLMNMPACIANCIATGASYDADVGMRSYAMCTDPTTAPDMVACFANANGATDVFAPGAMITTSRLGGGTTTGAGGSYASPHAVGCAAVLRHAVPGASPDAIENALESTGVPVLHNHSGLTFPRIDCLAAYNELHSAKPPHPIPMLYAEKSASRSDVILLWDDSPTDGQHDHADLYGVYRSTGAPDSGFERILDVADTPATHEQAVDEGACGSTPPFSKLHFYRVSAFNGAGNSGDIPPS